jgi:hypothetical protein
MNQAIILAKVCRRAFVSRDVEPISENRLCTAPYTLRRTIILLSGYALATLITVLGDACGCWRRLSRHTTRTPRNLSSHRLPVCRLGELEFCVDCAASA